MGKRKKSSQNVVKVNLGDCEFKRGEILPVRVQQSSKDGRRMEQTVHKIPMPRNNPPPPTFNPSLAFEATGDYTFLEACDPADESGGPECVRPCFPSPRCILTCHLA